MTANVLHPGIGNTNLFQNVPSLILTAQKYTISWMFKVNDIAQLYKTLYDSRTETSIVIATDMKNNQSQLLFPLSIHLITMVVNVFQT